MSIQKFCEQCGKPLEPGVRFCESCGTAVTAATETATPTPPPPPPITSPPFTTAKAPSSPAQQQSQASSVSPASTMTSAPKRSRLLIATRSEFGINVLLLWFLASFVSRVILWFIPRFHLFWLEWYLYDIGRGIGIVVLSAAVYLAISRYVPKTLRLRFISFSIAVRIVVCVVLLLCNYFMARIMYWGAVWPWNFWFTGVVVLSFEAYLIMRPSKSDGV